MFWEQRAPASHSVSLGSHIFALTPCWVYNIEEVFFTLVTKSKTMIDNTIFSLPAMPESYSFSNIQC